MIVQAKRGEALKHLFLKTSRVICYTIITVRTRFLLIIMDLSYLPQNFQCNGHHQIPPTGNGVRQRCVR